MKLGTDYKFLVCIPQRCETLRDALRSQALFFGSFIF